jgi:mono/diheme cytochrome c family protein
LKALLPLLVVAAVLAEACYDPVHQDAIANLGGEAPGVAPGPRHRPGQPCLTCHGPEGPADPELAVAGTVYAVRGGQDPLPGASVAVTDVRGASRVMRSNEVGSFWITKAEWSPAFPLSVELEAEGIRRAMTTRISRDGSCASCHRDGGDRTFMPAIFLRDR